MKRHMDLNEKGFTRVPAESTLRSTSECCSRTQHANQHFVNDGEQGSRISEFES